MKQLNFFKTLLLLAAFLMPQGMMAYDFMDDDGLCYNINSDGTSVTVTYENFSPFLPSYSNLSGTLTIPPSVTNEGITYSVTSIGDNAFWRCDDLTSVTIPNSVASIDFFAFAYCIGLTDLYSYIENPSSVSLGDDVFDGVPTSTCVLHVPAETAELYRAADQWSAFDNIDEMITGIDAIASDRKGDGTYYNLLGQPVKNPTSGIYILDGKKVLVK